MHNLEPVKVATVLVSSVLGPAVAEVVGPYSVIILAASLGAAWSVGSFESGSKWSAFWFFIRVNATAILITVTLASFIGRYIGLEDSTWLLAPIALIIGGIGDNWGGVLMWVTDTIKKFINTKTGGS